MLTRKEANQSAKGCYDNNAASPFGPSVLEGNASALVEPHAAVIIHLTAYPASPTAREFNAIGGT